MLSSAPRTPGPLQQQETQLAWRLLAPTIISVALIVLLPLLAVFWISFKPIELSDLRAPSAKVYERMSGKISAEGDTATLVYRLSNSSRERPVTSVVLEDQLPAGLQVDQQALDQRCQLSGSQLHCELGDFSAGYKEKLRIPVTASQAFVDSPTKLRAIPAVIIGQGESVLTNSEFTLANFSEMFSSDEFMEVLGVTVFYTVFATVGALIAGLFAAMLLNQSFFGRGAFRGLLLFPYVAPVIAVAFTWVTLFDPFSGSANALLLQMGVVDQPINFFSERPLALVMVTVFEVWRYFPLSFLFILARMQSFDTDMYEAADMDGATPLQKFWYLSVPQLLGILSVLFLLRFIWTFNKFDDIFLLTGGNAGTRTLTVNVYEQAFSVGNIGAGAAVAVVVFLTLLVFSLLFLKFASKEEGL